MAKINSSLAFALLILNLCGTIALVGLTAASTQKRQSPYIPRNETNRNFSITNLNLFEKQSQIKSQEKKNKIDLSNLDMDEFALSYNQISPQFSYKKKLRKLSSGNDMSLVLLLDLITLLNTFIIMFSFCADPNECCVENSLQDLCCGLCVGSCLYKCCCNPRCRCECHSNNSGAFVVLLIVCVLMFLGVNACGKHASRYVGLTINMLLFIAMFILTNIFYFDSKSAFDPAIIYSILGITGFMSLIDFLGLLLPNLACCSSLRYELVPSTELMVSPSPYMQDVPSHQSTSLYSQPQPPTYVPPSSDFVNVPTYPPNNPVNQGYANPQLGYAPPTVPLQPI